MRKTIGASNCGDKENCNILVSALQREVAGEKVMNDIKMFCPYCGDSNSAPIMNRRDIAEYHCEDCNKYFYIDLHNAKYVMLKKRCPTCRKVSDEIINAEGRILVYRCKGCNETFSTERDE